uniref:Uncharacterized protein n=1 Tax=Globodera rostochiensis TaxID=31243 RepID=A0A914HGC9_GLORO
MKEPIRIWGIKRLEIVDKLVISECVFYRHNNNNGTRTGQGHLPSLGNICHRLSTNIALRPPPPISASLLTHLSAGMLFSSFTALLTMAVVSLIGGTSADEYYGVRLGSFRNTTSGMFGNVWLANSTVIQITDFRMDKIQKHEILFAFASSDGKFAAVKSLYNVVIDDRGENLLMPISKKHLGNVGPEKLRLVAVTPAGKKIHDFKQFGVATGKTMVG